MRVVSGPLGVSMSLMGQSALQQQQQTTHVLGLTSFCRSSSIGMPSGSVVSPPSDTSPRYISTVATRFSPDALLCTGSSNQS